MSLTPTQSRTPRAVVLAIRLHSVPPVTVAHRPPVRNPQALGGRRFGEVSTVSLMSTVLGSLAPDMSRSVRDREAAVAGQAIVAPPMAERVSHNVELPQGFGPVYNEEAFRYFLQIERKRASRSNNRFLLLLVDLEREPGQSAHLDAPTG